MLKKESKKVKLSRSIKMKLLVMPLLIVFIGVLIIGSVSSYITRQNLLNEMEVNGFARLEEVIGRIQDNTEALETIDNQIEEKIHVAATVVVNNQDQLNNNYLKKLAKDLGVLEINWYDANAVTLYSTVEEYVGWQPDDGHPVDVFMKSEDTFKVEDIRIDTVSGESKKYGYMKAPNGHFVQVGLDAADVQALTEKFSYQNIVEEIAKDEFLEYGIFIGTDYSSIAHSNRELIGHKYTDEGTHTAAVEGKPYSQMYYYEPSQVNVYDILYPVNINGEHIGALSIGFSMVNVEKAIQKNYITFALLGFGIFLLIGIILYFFSNQIIKIIDELKNNLSAIASGDFSIKIKEKLIKRKDELGIMATAVQETVDILGQTLKEVKNQSMEVNTNADTLAGTSEEMSRSSQELAETIQQVAEGATNQARDLDDIIGSLSELTSNIDHVYAELEGVKSETDHAENKANSAETPTTKVVGFLGTLTSKILSQSLRIATTY